MGNSPFWNRNGVCSWRPLQLTQFVNNAFSATFKIFHVRREFYFFYCKAVMHNKLANCNGEFSVCKWGNAPFLLQRTLGFYKTEPEFWQRCLFLCKFLSLCTNSFELDLRAKVQESKDVLPILVTHIFSLHGLGLFLSMNKTELAVHYYAAFLC